jgi:hypothetical protein
MSESAVIVSMVGAYVATGFVLLKYSLGSAILNPKLVPVKIRSRR